MKPKIDWLVGFTTNGETCAECGEKEYDFLPCFFNAKTLGLNKYGHKEFQMVLEIDHKMVMYILNSLGVRVQAGEKFQNGDSVAEILQGYDIRLQEFFDGEETVLRVLLPDPNGRFPDDSECDCIYSMQNLPLQELMIKDENPTLRLYQMVHNQNTRKCIFSDLNTVKTENGNRIPEELYECVYEGKLGIKFPEEAFTRFNISLPIGYKGRSMSVSDVIEFEYSDSQTVFYYCNPCGFAMIRFDREKTIKGEIS